MAVLKDLNQRMNQTILVITHDNEVASYGDRILHMRDGRIETECGKSRIPHGAEVVNEVRPVGSER